MSTLRRVGEGSQQGRFASPPQTSTLLGPRRQAYGAEVLLSSRELQVPHPVDHFNVVVLDRVTTAFVETQRVFETFRHVLSPLKL